MRRELYFGDNLDVLREHIADESVDLIYLDPPFNSNASYNMLFKDKSGDTSEAQIQAFDDTWTWGHQAEEAMDDIMMREGVPLKLRQLMPALRSFLGTNDMMAVRLVELHRVLKHEGSIYLHCDPTASHYLKLVLDAVFEKENYRSEISWRRSFAHSNTKQGATNYGGIRDVIFFYSKSQTITWNQQYTEYDEHYVKQNYRHDDGDGRLYRRDNLTAAKSGGDVSYDWRVKRPIGGSWTADTTEEFKNPLDGWEYLGRPPYKGRYWAYSRENMVKMSKEDRLAYSSSGMPEYKRYLDEMPGVALQNDWDDLPPVSGKERLGYPTQKPIGLLERIILTSSNPGDTVLDPFCGCGTAVDAAQGLGRGWVGIDVTHLAIGLIERRMRDRYPHLKEKGAYTVRGTPTTVDAAQRLFNESPFQFERWAVNLIRGAREYKSGGGGDGGVDGLLYYKDHDTGRYRKGLISVKGGQKLSPTMVRDLHGTVQADADADFGIFISLHEPTQGMKTRAAEAGVFSPGGHRMPVLQTVTIEELLDGRTPQLPGLIDERAVFKQAPKAKKKSTQGKLL